jgi:hypothetical protein
VIDWKLAAVLVSLVVAPAGVAAQTPPSDPHAVQPERPTVATHAGTVAAGWLEIEAGTEIDRYTDGSGGGLAPVLFKLGLAPRLQLGVQVPVVRPPLDGGTRLGDLAVGVKWRIVERAPVVGDFAILPGIKVPSGSEIASTGTTDLNVLFISSHEFGQVAMDVNAGYTRRSGDGTAASRSASVWTASFAGPARGPLGWVAELYGFPATSGPAATASIVAFLGGPTVLVRRWLALDGGVIVPITGRQPRALYLGVVYNVGRIWTHQTALGDHGAVIHGPVRYNRPAPG